MRLSGWARRQSGGDRRAQAVIQYRRPCLAARAVLLLLKHPRRHIVPPEISWLKIAEYALDRAMPRLTHQLGRELGVIIGADGKQAAPEWVL